MDILLGNFGSVFGAGIFLNLSFSLFRQVREFGLDKIEKEINKAFEEWRLEELDLANRLDPEKSKDCDDIRKKVEEIVKDTQEKLKNKPMKKRISFCSLASILCVIGLSLCALFGLQTLSLSKWTGKSFLYITFGLSFLPLPVALAWTFAENIRIKNIFMKEIKVFRKLTRKTLDDAVKDLNKKVE